MSLSGYQQQFTINLAKLIAFASSLGVGLTMGDAFRSNDQQLLFYYGRTFDDEQKLVKTKRRSWTLSSNHMRRLAQDYNFFIDGKLVYKHEKITQLGDYWEGLHEKNRWGGNFKHTDTPHFEMNV